MMLLVVVADEVRSAGALLSEECKESQWLTVDGVAYRLQVSPETVRRWIRAGRLPVLDLGSPKGGYRILPSALESFIARRYGAIGKPPSE